MGTVFTNLLVGEDPLKCVFEDLFSTHFLVEGSFAKISIIKTGQKNFAGAFLITGVVCESYLQMFIKLVYQAGEELISILLFSYIQLLVPHLEDLQQTNILAYLLLTVGLYIYICKWSSLSSVCQLRVREWGCSQMLLKI